MLPVLHALVLLLLGTALTACGGGGGEEASPPPTSTGCNGPLNVGYRVITLPSGRKAAVWYPTEAAASTFNYAPDTASTLALNAAPATCSTFPLLLFSHGLGGCGTQSLFITETLARRGYVVAAPDHADGLCSVDGAAPSGSSIQEPSVADPASWNETTYLDRKRDLQALLDTLLGSSPWINQIDAQRIGIVGHSLGGYSALGMAGAWPSWRDTRIKAALLLSPYVAPYQAKGTLGDVTGVPLMYQGAQLDIFITPGLEGPTGAYALAAAPKYLAKLFLGTHFEWTNVLCGSTGTVDNCLRTRGNAALITDYATAFFDRHLKSRPAALLDGNGTGLLAYQAQPN